MRLRFSNTRLLRANIPATRTGRPVLRNPLSLSRFVARALPSSPRERSTLVIHVPASPIATRSERTASERVPCFVPEGEAC